MACIQKTEIIPKTQQEENKQPNKKMGKIHE